MQDERRRTPYRPNLFKAVTSNKRCRTTKDFVAGYSSPWPSRQRRPSRRPPTRDPRFQSLVQTGRSSSTETSPTRAGRVRQKRFALFFPEKRPFFLEGIELFSTPIQAVYTRTITSPRWGARATDKIGHTAYTALDSSRLQARLAVGPLRRIRRRPNRLRGRPAGKSAAAVLPQAVVCLSALGITPRTQRLRRPACVRARCESRKGRFRRRSPTRRASVPHTTAKSRA